MASSPDRFAEPRGPWLKIWGVAALFLLVGFAALELFWRQRGYSPTIVTSPELWAYQRARLRGAGRDTIALVGGSRIQFGFNPEAFVEEHSDVQVVQLAVSGKPPFATLQDLAEDESFGGTVICSVVEPTMFPGWNSQQAFVDYFHEKWGPGARVSLLLAAALQQHLVFLQPRLGTPKLLKSFLQGRLPPINYVRTRFDRMQIADYGLLSERNIRGLTTTRITRTRAVLPEVPPAPEEMWRDFVADLAAFSARIESRGGRVFYVRFPARGRYQTLYDEYFPRERFWDTLAATVGENTLHYEDMPGAGELHLPDDSHLDIPSGIRFTKWIARELAARGNFD